MSLNKLSPTLIFRSTITLSPEFVFAISSLVVNAGNYLYNIYLGRQLGPEQFAEAGLLVTLLLMISFLGMTFQLVSTKYCAWFSEAEKAGFYRWILKISWISGTAVGLGFFLGAPWLARYFQTADAHIFQIMAMSMPFYFAMSVKRGVLQGTKSYLRLSTSYQSEMWSRLLLTLGLVLLGFFYSSTAVAIGITGSIMMGYYSISKVNLGVKSLAAFFNPNSKRVVMKFFLFTAFYEVIQIIINYGDNLLVKHYFTAFEAGIYASTALIGRVIYFAAWMMVMILLPEVVAKKKDHQPHRRVFIKYLLGISVFDMVIVSVCMLFPEQIMNLVFGPGYQAAASLLWQYALATTFFAITNVFVYYNLSVDRYFPVFFSALFALVQLIGFHFYHNSLHEMVLVQTVVMGALLAINATYFLLGKN